MAGLRAGKSNGLVKEYVSALRHWMLLHDLEGGVVFKPGDKEDAGVIPLPEEIKITIATVYSDDAAGRKCKISSGNYIRCLAISDYGEVG